MSEEYQKAKKQGEKEYRRAVSEGWYPYLPALDKILPGISELRQADLGTVEVPLSLFAGTKTEGRQNAFSWGFMPVFPENTEFAYKWSSLYDIQLEEGLRDPVLAYEYMHRFYVEEGNKRVSVLRYLDAYSIPAKVIRILPARDGDPEKEIYYEYLDFYRVTGLFGIEFSEKGRYLKLAALFGRNLEHRWPEEDIKKFRSAYAAFSGLYLKKFAELPNMTPADAMLLYLQTYSVESLTEGNSEIISKRIDTLRKEILTVSGTGAMERQEIPAENAPRSGFFSLLQGPSYSGSHPLRAAFFYDLTPENSRWAYGHELGRNALETNYEGMVVTSAYGGCINPAATRDAMAKALEEGAEVFFTTSPGQMPAALRFALDNPKAKVLNCSVNLARNAVRTYYLKLYEAKFLLGILAASLTRDEKIGYVADLPLVGTIADINAFAIGAAMVRPDIRISLKWASLADADWHEELRSEQVRIISGPDLIKPASGDHEYGLYDISGGRPVHLAAPLMEWGNFYSEIIKTVLDGTWGQENPKDNQALNYWWGMSADVVDIILSKKLSYYSTKMIDTFRLAVSFGQLTPFDGELHSRTGIIRSADDAPLTAEEIISMDWLNDNVDGEIPPLESFTETARETLLLAGLRGEKT